MVESEAAIVNIALGKLGIRNFITDMADDTPEAITASKFYANSRDKVLRVSNWPFARRRAYLAAIPITRDGWGGVYALPADCLAPRLIWSGSRNPSPSQIIKWTIEYDQTYRRILLCDQTQPLLIYTALIDIVALYPPAFADAVAACLAADMAVAVTGRLEARVEMLNEYKAALSYAITDSSGDEETDEEPDSEFITGR